MDPDLRFGAIADDFTGGSDLAGMLYEQGAAVTQCFGVPSAEAAEVLPAGCGAVVVSLKTRSIAAAEAVAQSLDALAWLRGAGARQVQFKYCSTFDSTPEGNIGPVTEALQQAMGAGFTVAVPALPVNGRTQYLGHLFVGGQPLSESPMRHHPLNPMDDANLVRFLQRQCRTRVGLIDWFTVQRGPAAVREEAERLRAAGVAIALADALTDRDLAVLAEAVCGWPLITGGSGLGRHLPRHWNSSPRVDAALPRPERDRPRLLLAGSCSAATLAQLEDYASTGATVLRVRSPRDDARAEVLRRLTTDGVACVASSAPAGDRAPEPGAAEEFERLFASLARAAVEQAGVREIVVAGGETSGAVVQSLDVHAAALTGIVAPGVPSLVSLGARPLRLVLKSGNFGGPRFFRDALHHLDSL